MRARQRVWLLAVLVGACAGATTPTSEAVQIGEVDSSEEREADIEELHWTWCNHPEVRAPLPVTEEQMREVVVREGAAWLGERIIFVDLVSRALRSDWSDHVRGALTARLETESLCDSSPLPPGLRLAIVESYINSPRVSCIVAQRPEALVLRDELSDADLRALASASTLRFLGLSHATRVRGAGLQSTLPLLTNLRQLVLEGVDASGALVHVAELTKLQRVSLAGTPIPDEDVRYLASLPALTHLDLSGTGVGYEAVRHLASGRAPLRALALGSGRVTDRAVELLDGMDLESLDLEGSGIGDGALSHVSALNRLTELSIARTQVTDVGVAALSSLSALRVLDLRATEVTNTGLERLVGLSNLQRLSLRQARGVDDQGLEHVGRLRGLTHLDLAFLDVTSAGLRHLEGLPLREIRLEHSTVRDAELPVLATFASLRVVRLHATRVTATGLGPLNQLTQLERVTLPVSSPVSDAWQERGVVVWRNGTQHSDRVTKAWWGN